MEKNTEMTRKIDNSLVCTSFCCEKKDVQEKKKARPFFLYSTLRLLQKYGFQPTITKPVKLSKPDMFSPLGGIEGAFNFMEIGKNNILNLKLHK